MAPDRICTQLSSQKVQGNKPVHCHFKVSLSLLSHSQSCSGRGVSYLSLPEGPPSWALLDTQSFLVGPSWRMGSSSSPLPVYHGLGTLLWTDRCPWKHLLSYHVVGNNETLKCRRFYHYMEIKTRHQGIRGISDLTKKSYILRKLSLAQELNN